MSEETKSSGDTGKVIRAREGDRSAYSDLVERYYGIAYALARSRLRRAEDALDAVQDTFLKAYQKLATLREPGRFFAWMKEILLRRCSDVRDSRERRERLVERVAGQTNRNPMEGPDSEDLYRAVVGAIEELPESYREPIYLFYIEEKSYLEIADRTRKSVGAIRGLLYRGNKELRDRLRPYWSEEGAR